MILRNHIKCRASFHIEYVLFRLTKNKMQTGDTHHVQKRGWYCGHSFIKSLNLIGSWGMKPTFLKWCAAGAFPLPTVVILSPGVLAHTHTQSSQRLRLLTRLRTARRLDWGQRSHACISGGRHYSAPVFLFASSYLRTGKWEQGVNKWMCLGAFAKVCILDQPLSSDCM